MTSARRASHFGSFRPVPLDPAAPRDDPRRMLPTLIVTTALLLAAVGVRAERRGRAIELWLCNAVAAGLLAMTVSAQAAGRIG